MQTSAAAQKSMPATFSTQNKILPTVWSLGLTATARYRPINAEKMDTDAKKKAMPINPNPLSTLANRRLASPNWTGASTSANFAIVGVCIVLSLSGCVSVVAQDDAVPAVASATDLPPVPKGFDIKYASESVSLIPAQGQGNWDTIDFAGAGDVEIEDGTIVIEAGEGLTGVYWDQDGFPKTNYELTMEVRRTRGIDFFCGPVFPVNDSHCCLIVGGWAGAVVGLSNIDNKDASENETTMLMDLKDNRWYLVRVRVLQDQIIAWIDGQCVVNANIAGRKLSLRGDTELCTPLGLCTYCTTSETRNFTMRKIQPQTQFPTPTKKSKKQP